MGAPRFQIQLRPLGELRANAGKPHSVKLHELACDMHFLAVTARDHVFYHNTDTGLDCTEHCTGSQVGLAQRSSPPFLAAGETRAERPEGVKIKNDAEALTVQKPICHHKSF